MAELSSGLLLKAENLKKEIDYRFVGFANNYGRCKQEKLKHLKNYTCTFT